MLGKIKGLLLLYIFSGGISFSEIKDTGIRNFSRSEHMAGSAIFPGHTLYISSDLLKDGEQFSSFRQENPFETDQPDSLKLKVHPAWYKSTAAYILYGFFLIFLMCLVKWIEDKRKDISNRKERLKELLEYRRKEKEYINQAILTEKELISLKNEKLRDEMLRQDKELANQAMNLLRKHEFLIKIRQELLNLSKAVKEKPTIEKIDSIISGIDREVDYNKQRRVFELAFDEVHDHFMKKLKSRYPALTPTELRLCAFLKMNISTKEIAPLMNISVRGVEICRYRIRKKLNLERTTNLTSMLINF